MRNHWLTWSLLSAAFAAVTTIFGKYGVRGIDSNLATAIRTTVILLFTWTLVVVNGAAYSLSSAPRRTWLFLILSGLATGLSWLCYFRALQLGPASRVAPIDKLSVVLVIVLSAVFLGERLSVLKLVGGLFIALGAMVLVYG